MRSSYPLQIKYVKLIQIKWIKNICIGTNPRHVYTLNWLEKHNILKKGYSTNYAEYYKRYCYA
jgi:hypothetical protein